MFSSPRQLLKIIVIIIVIGALGLGAYFLFFAGPQNQAPDQAPAPAGPAGPKVRPLTELPVLSPALSPAGQIVYYRQADGRVFSLDPTTSQIRQLTNTGLKNLQKSVWGPNARQVISFFRKPTGERQVFHYSFDSQRATELPAQIKQVAFDPTGAQIAYQFLDPTKGVNALSVADPQNQNYRKIADLPSQTSEIFWIQDRVVYLTQSSGTAAGSIISINPQTGGTQTIQAGIFGLSAEPSPSGAKILYTQGTQNAPYQPKLLLFDLLQKEIVDTGLTTLPQKCAFSPDETVLYCAVPENIPSSAVLPNHWRSGDFVSNDQIWQVNLNRLQGKQLTGATGYDISWLGLSADGLALVFQDKASGKLYRLELPQN